MKIFLSILISVVAARPVVAAALSEADIRAQANVVCENANTLLGIDTVHRRAFQKDKDKAAGWEIALLEYTPGATAHSFSSRGTFVVIHAEVPVPLLFQVWMTAEYRTVAGATGLYLNYAFGANEPQGTANDLPCTIVR